MPTPTSVRALVEDYLVKHPRVGVEKALEFAVTEQLDYYRYVLQNGRVSLDVPCEVYRDVLPVRLADRVDLLSNCVVEPWSLDRAVLHNGFLAHPVDVFMCHNVADADYGSVTVYSGHVANNKHPPGLMITLELVGLHSFKCGDRAAKFAAAPFMNILYGVSGVSEILNAVTDDKLLTSVQQRMAQSQADVAADADSKASSHYGDRWGEFA